MSAIFYYLSVNKMKKIISVIVSFSIAFGCFCSCSDLNSSDTVSSQSTSTQSSSQSIVETTEATTTTTTTTTSVTTSAAEASEPTSESVTAASVTTTTQTEQSTVGTDSVASPASQTKKTAVTTKRSTVTSKATKRSSVTAKKPAVTTAKPSEATTSTAASTAVTTTQKPAPVPADVTKDTADKLYYIPQTTKLYDLKKNCVGSIYAYSFYTGRYDPNYPGYVKIDYLYGKYLIAAGSVRIQKNARILPTACIGQMGGRIYGYSACGPAAATILVNSQLGLNWNKDDLLLHCERNRLNDQGSLRYGGGITAPRLMTAINGFSKGKVKVQNVYGRDPSTILKKQIDAGNRSIVVVQYTSYIVTHYSSGTHFVVICGYEYINGVLYFYYADPFYGQGGRSLLRVRASTLAYSMNMVVIEPRCILTVK